MHPPDTVSGDQSASVAALLVTTTQR